MFCYVRWEKTTNVERVKKCAKYLHTQSDVIWYGSHVFRNGSILSHMLLLSYRPCHAISWARATSSTYFYCFFALKSTNIRCEIVFKLNSFPMFLLLSFSFHLLHACFFMFTILLVHLYVYCVLYAYAKKERERKLWSVSENHEWLGEREWERRRGREWKIEKKKVVLSMWPLWLQARFISNFANRFAIAHECERCIEQNIFCWGNEKRKWVKKNSGM